jgi:hypothetical protein
MENPKFLPQVWHADGWPPMLVCGRRWLHPEPLLDPKRWRDPKAEGHTHPPLVTGGRYVTYTYEKIYHGVAIRLGENPLVFLNLPTGDPSTHEDWVRDEPETHGLNRRAAGLALAEGWKCVNQTIDGTTKQAIMSLNPKRGLLTYRGGTPMRNIGIWLAWGRWQRDKLTFDQRLAEITAWGFPITPKAFRRLLEDDGMSI